MKRISLVTLLLGAMALTSFAGGLVTNTNQSAQFVRMLSRNASTQIDAVYYNPAGLTMLQDGWHFSLNNQSIFQEKSVNSKFPWLNNGEYIGDVKAPVFPSVYAVYKVSDLAFSVGFGPVGGGGSAIFERGLPSFEIPLTKLVPGLSGLKQLPAPHNYNVSGYNADLYFDGKSVYYGIQAGATYKINDIISGYAGVRYTPAKNVYMGHIQNIQLVVNNNPVNAKDWLIGTAAPAVTGIANQASAAATQLTGTANSLQPIITQGGGAYTLSQLQNMGYISSAQQAQLEGGLLSLGLTSAQVAAMQASTVQTTFAAAGTQYQAQATQLNQTSAGLNATGGTLGDKNVETEQTGAGWTPVLGVNITAAENLNIALKYEHKTILKLTNSTTVDDLGLFPDGKENRYDIPGMLAVGVGYQPSRLIEAQVSYNYYFDKGVGWGPNTRESVYNRNVTREIDKNGWELALGLQFNLTDRFALSTGALTSNPGIADSYQSDFSYSNTSYTLAAGFMWKITEQLAFDAGIMNVIYKDAELTYNDPDAGNYQEILGKKTFGLGFGLSYSIGR